ncbi:MAG: cation transporter, partial [Fibrobacterales bacterium]|nr:cation transporter [Fibrobacterales bacterium]
MQTEVISAESRDRAIVRASVLGIVANVLLSAFKAAVGLATNSIAIALDAVNNLSDAAASIITVVGTKLARRRP